MPQKSTPQDIEELVNLYKQVNLLTEMVAKNQANAAVAVGIFFKQISRLKNELADINNTFLDITSSRKKSVK
jgi:hypothetical protein